MCDIPFEGPQLSTGLAAIPSDPIPSSETVTWQDLGTSAGCLRHLSRSASRLRPRTLPFSHSVLSTGYSACSGFYGPNNGHDRSIVAHPKKKCIAFFMRPKR